MASLPDDIRENVSVDFIGEGESLEYLKQLSEELGLQRQVAFRGNLARAEVYAALKNYHLFVQPSLYEGVGLTVAEAMAAKVPVLVSDMEGPMEVISDGRYGLHFASGSVDDLCDKLTYAYHHYENLLAIAAGPAFDFVLKHPLPSWNGCMLSNRQWYSARE